MKARSLALPIALLVLVGCSSTAPSATQSSSPGVVVSSASPASTSAPTTASSVAPTSAVAATAETRYVPTPVPRPLLSAWSMAEACAYFNGDGGVSVSQQRGDLGNERQGIARTDKEAMLAMAAKYYAFAQALDDAAGRSPVPLGGYFADMAEYEYSIALDVANAAYLQEDVMNGVTPATMDIPSLQFSEAASSARDIC